VTVLNPRTHPRGAPPSFSLPLPNPNPSRMTDALWWLVCMRELLEPIDSENGGTYAKKPGYHNAGENLPDHGLGNSKTDHSIRRAPDRSGPWWLEFGSAHDWTFLSAQRGNYANIQKYTRRLVNAMRDPKDLRPDDVYAYTLGQTDGDPIVEGYNEYTDSDDTSADKTHLWHRHDSFRRNIIGDFWAMWKALTIDMGWTYAEWLKSVTPKPPAKPVEELPVNQTDFTKLFLGALKDPAVRKEVGAAMLEAAGWSEGFPGRKLSQHANDEQVLRNFLFGKPDKDGQQIPVDSPVSQMAKAAEIIVAGQGNLHTA